MAKKVASRNVDIVTEQNVVVSYELATVMQRFVIGFIDCLFVWIASTLLFSLWPGEFPERNDFFGISMLLIWFYQLIAIVFMNGRTAAMRIFGTRVISLNGKSLEFSDYFLRWIMRPLDITFSACAVGIFTMLSSEKRQRLGDMLAGTAMIRNRPATHFTLKDILTFHENNQTQNVKFPGIKHVDEESMLFIKNLLNNQENYQDGVYREALEQASERFAELLRLDEVPMEPKPFLNQLVNDYITLTR